MRISHLGIYLLGALAFGFITVGVAGQLHAQPITLGTGSTVNATAVEEETDPTSSNNVTSLPYSNTTATSEGDVSSSLDATLSTSGFNFAYTQSFVVDSHTEGDGDIFFTAGTNATFSIAGYETVMGDAIAGVKPATATEGAGELVTYLFDMSDSTFVYSYDQTIGIPATPTVVSDISIGGGSSATLTLDTSGGSLSGALNAGDSYEFYASEDMTDIPQDPNLTGNVSITFAQSAVPLPPAALAGLLPLLVGLLILRPSWLKQGSTKSHSLARI